MLGCRQRITQKYARSFSRPQSSSAPVPSASPGSWPLRMYFETTLWMHQSGYHTWITHQEHVSLPSDPGGGGANPLHTSSQHHSQCQLHHIQPVHLLTC
ncbi:hypothetical protein E2C01_020311 [Portunus trituberculatus]|uniref:Uncharacterized protein n=1 Tax=Portunus trituberculatus TaxID=210409 RepID=A0A5B7E168_PORTR|nr:hypothetical protein [Portunus trituberculatus]